MIAALYVTTNGGYFGLDGVDPWDETRDARKYRGPHSVIAHPPCQRWGRMWFGSPRNPVKKKGDDNGCFKAALRDVRKYCGVLEHPAYSHAWEHFGIARPPFSGGWIKADDKGGWTCHVEQGFYGHYANKPTWLYAVGCELPNLRWGQGAQRLDQAYLAKHGYAKACKLGMVSARGGGGSVTERDGTPVPFRNMLIDMARSAGR